MHPSDCPAWEYNDHPNKTSILQEKIKPLLIELRNGDLDSLTSASNTRPVHFRLFRQLAPDECTYFAGSFGNLKLTH